MKVRTWIRRYIQSTWIEDYNIKKLLIDNAIYDFSTCKEQMLDINLDEIVDKQKNDDDCKAGYRYSNRLYDLIHKNSIFCLEKDDLEYEIIEQYYPKDIPYAECEFTDVEEFHEWMLKEGRKERKLNESW